MMAAVQPFLSGAISKTVEYAGRSHGRGNFERLHGGLAAGTEGHRHLPRRLQALATAEYLGRQAEAGVRGREPEELRSQRIAARARSEPVPRPSPAAPVEALRTLDRRKLADERQAITHKFSVGQHEGYLTVGLYEQRPARRNLHHHGQGRLHGFRPDGFLRHRRLPGVAVRRAAQGAVR